MLNLCLKLSLTSFKNKFQQKQLALYKSYASAQSGNPDQSWTFSCLYLVLYLQISHRPFNAGYRHTFSLHQKGTSLSVKAVAPSQYDLSLVGRSNTNTITTPKGSLYTRLYLNIFGLMVVIHVVIAFCFNFLCSFLKGNVGPSASDLSTYWCWGRVYSEVEGQPTHINIFSLFFCVPDDLVNGVKK